MEKINFENNKTSAGATTMNQFQKNIENAVSGTVLYEGSTTSNVSLKETALNYKFLEIYLERNGIRKIVKIDATNSRKFDAMFMFKASESVLQLASSNYTVSGNSISKNEETYINFNSNGSFSLSTQNTQISIVKVIGFK